jgi:mRNA interferase MazF
MNVGDIYWVELPPANGREQAGRRPAVILQDDSVASRSPMVFVVPLTTVVGATRYPGVVPITAEPTTGLSQHSFALVFQFRAIDRRRIRDRIGTISPSALTAVFEALDHLTGRSQTA